MNQTLSKALAALLFSGVPLLAQIATIPAFSPAVTTGAVGLAASQTAQLSVVNLNVPSSTTTPPPTATLPCAVQLEFWDSQGKMVKSVSIASLGGGATGSLQIKLSDVPNPTSPLRTEVRGVVRRPTPTSTTGVTIPPGSTLQPIFSANCAVATTLEIFDTATGMTQSLTSDVHALQEFLIPLPAVGRSL
jgi:hypothetical protein